MNTVIPKRLTREEMFTELMTEFFNIAAEATDETTVTFTLGYLGKIFSNALYELQLETEERVRRQIVRGTLN